MLAVRLMLVGLVGLLFPWVLFRFSWRRYVPRPAALAPLAIPAVVALSFLALFARTLHKLRELSELHEIDTLRELAERHGSELLARGATWSNIVLALTLALGLGYLALVRRAPQRNAPSTYASGHRFDAAASAAKRRGD